MPEGDAGMPERMDASLAGELGRAVGELTRSGGCHTVVLYGSRARGDADADSDVDLFAVGSDAPDGPRPFDSALFDFDIWIASESDVAADLDEYLKIEGGLVLRQKEGYGDRLLKAVDARVTRGPGRPSARECAQKKAWLSRMAVRAEREDEEGRYRLAWLVAELPRVLFELEGKFWLGPKRSLVLLRERYPEFHAEYAALLAAPTPALALPCVRRIIEEF
jgi:predicted nucleotidyltransferase